MGGASAGQPLDEVVELANPSGAGAGKLAFALVAVKK
jgi:hypothetical protein